MLLGLERIAMSGITSDEIISPTTTLTKPTEVNDWLTGLGFTATDKVVFYRKDFPGTVPNAKAHAIAIFPYANTATPAYFLIMEVVGDWLGCRTRVGSQTSNMGDEWVPAGSEWYVIRYE